MTLDLCSFVNNSEQFAADLYVGTNIKRVSQEDILRHEMRHFNALLAVADAAHAAGGVMNKSLIQRSGFAI